MRRWLRRLRGILGTGAVWGATGTVFGAVVGALGSLLGAPVAGSMIVSGLWMGAAGFVLGSGFAVVLTAMHGRRTLDELTSGKAALWGALMGIAVPILSNILSIATGEAPLAQLIPAILANAGLYGAFSASLAAGTVIAAKRAPELKAGERPELPDSTLVGP